MNCGHHITDTMKVSRIMELGIVNLYIGDHDGMGINKYTG